MRYLPHNILDRQEMLNKIGVQSVDDLFAEVPEQARLDGPIEGVGSQKSEWSVEGYFRTLANKNLTVKDGPSFIGCGAYHHHVPAAVDHLIQRGEFLTSYTPYQPEISQGTLQSLFEFQTQVAQLTGMEIANASMYDGANATAEAVMMAGRLTKRSKAALSGNLHPHYAEVVYTAARHLGFSVEQLSPALHEEEDLTSLIDDETSCLVVQYPDFFGRVRDLSEVAQACHKKGVLLVVVVTEIVSLGLLPPPGEMGADIVACEGQSLGNALNFGGPYVGLLACREKFVRQMPGRLCGQTVDASGRRGFVLTLSTREQHIRREKATSNICTNAGLCALAFSIHLSLLGETGLKRLAQLNHARAVQLAEKLEEAGVEVVTDAFFNEMTVRLHTNAANTVRKLVEKGILAGVPVSRFYADQSDLLILAVTELTELRDMDRLVRELEKEKI